MKFFIISLVLAVIAVWLTPYLDEYGRKAWSYITKGYKGDGRDETR